MKLENYKSEHIDDVVELKKLIQHQIENIEKCNWLDQVDEAIIRTLNVYESLQKIRVMKNEKQYDSKLSFLAAMLQGQGCNVHAIKFSHKKTD